MRVGMTTEVEVARGIGTARKVQFGIRGLTDATEFS